MSHVHTGGVTGSRPDNVKASMNTLQKDGLIMVTEIQEPYISGKGREDYAKVYYVDERDGHVVGR